jgi:hypothetical protein
MNNISMNPSFLIAVEEMARVVLYPCMLVVPTLVLMSLIVSLIKGFTAREGVSVNYGPVVRGFVLMGLLFFYQELLVIISGTIGAFAGFLNQPANIYASLDELAGGSSETTGEGLAAYVEETVQFFNSFNLLSLLQSFALGGVASIARKLIEILRQTLLGLLYITGPIAISLSVLPAFGQLVQKWLQNYLAVQCWSITLIILDNIVVLYRNLTQHQLGLMDGLSISEAAEKLDMILITCIIALLYLMVPYLTSLFVGQTQSAVYQSRTIATGAGATILMARGAAMVSGGGSLPAAASAAGSGSSFTQNALQEGGASGATTPPSYAGGGAGQSIPVRQ